MAATLLASTLPKDSVLDVNVRDNVKTHEKLRSRCIRSDRSASRVTWVECHKSKQPGCEFLVAAEGPLGTEQVSLPNVRRVDIVQEFEAAAGDTLAFDFITLLQAVEATTEKAAGIAATLTNLDSHATKELFSRHIGGAMDNARLGSRQKESIRSEITTFGRYELRFVLTVEEENASVLSQLMVSNIQVYDCRGRIPQSLLAIACVGKVVSS